MKKVICLVLLSFLLNVLHAASTTRLKEGNQTVSAVLPSLPTEQLNERSCLSIKQLEKLSGTRLSFKQKIGWWLVKKQLINRHKNDTPDKRQNNNALLGFIFSCAGLLLFPLFLIPGFILSNNALHAEKMQPGTLTKSMKDLAKAGQIISIVTGVLLLLAIAAVIAIIAAWSR